MFRINENKKKFRRHVFIRKWNSVIEIYKINNLNPQSESADWVIKSETSTHCFGLREAHSMAASVDNIPLVVRSGTDRTTYLVSPRHFCASWRWKRLCFLHMCAEKRVFFKSREPHEPRGEIQYVVQSVSFPVTRGMLPTFAIFQWAPAKPKPIMSVSFAPNYLVHTLFLGV